MSAEHYDDATYQKQRKAVWFATGVMAVATIGEVTAALSWYHIFPNGGMTWLLNILFVVMSAIKAFFIVGEFMHIKYETRALTVSILAPTMFLVWFIIAFVLEGQSWNVMRHFWQ